MADLDGNSNVAIIPFSAFINNMDTVYSYEIGPGSSRTDSKRFATFLPGLLVLFLRVVSVIVILVYEES